MTGWYSWLGFWAMLHVPVHFVVFLILLLIIPVEVYLVFLIFVLSEYLKEAYIDVSFGKFIKEINYHQTFQSILGKGAEEGDTGLTAGGRRISV